MAVNLNTRVARRMADRGVQLLRLSAGEARRLRPFLRRLESELVTRVINSSLSATSSSMLTSVLADVRTLIGSGFAAIAAEHSQFMAGLIRAESAFVAGTINQMIGVSVVNALAPSPMLRALSDAQTILGAPAEDWWSQQSQRMVFSFSQQVRLGISQGETNAQLIQRIRGTPSLPSLFDAPTHQIEALVRTSAQSVAHTARLETYRANDDVIKGMQQQSTLDTRTSDICIAYDGAAWDLDGNPINGTTLPFNGGPPRHFNCRSILVPIIKSWEELGSAVEVPEFESEVRASMDGEVPASTSFQDWFESRSESQQNEILGRGRAELFREGKITLQELLDQRGRPLTLRQLEG